MNDLQASVLTRLDYDELVRVTREFVEIPSPTGNEQSAGEYLAHLYRKLGLPVELQEVEPGRCNVICRWPGSGRGRSLMFSGHLDTASSGRHTVFTKGDWLFGPGATNMKGGLTAAYAATKALLAAGVTLKGDLINTAVVGDIEHTPVEDDLHSFSREDRCGHGQGSEFMLRSGVTADMAIIGEPTGLRLQCGVEGYVFAKITTFGKAHHALANHQTTSALEKMLKVVDAIRIWEAEYQERYRHPRMLPVVTLGGLTTGRPYAPVNTPRWAHLLVQVTTIPGTPPEQLKQEMEAVVARANDGDSEFQAEIAFYQVRSGYELSEREYVARVIARAHRRLIGEPPDSIESARQRVASSGPLFGQYGIPAITYGPGGLTRTSASLSQDGVNGPESLGFEHLANCARVYALAVLEACGARG